MVELSRHIESLMLKHDCVIVPGLGGFVAQSVPACWIASERQFLPPYRSVGFNQQLTLNDGLLVQSYMQAYDTNYPDTLKLINESVYQLKEELMDRGEIELPGIGTLTLGMGGQYHFIPNKSGVLSPEYYALDVLGLESVEKTSPRTKTINIDDGTARDDRPRKQSYTIKFNREIINYAAAVVVAVVSYALWASPISEQTHTVQQASSVISERLFPASASTHEVSPALNEIKATDDAGSQERIPEETEGCKSVDGLQAKTEGTAAASNVGAEGGYTIVLVSAVSLENAETYSARLQKEGFPEAVTYKKGKMVRVVYGRYATESAAQDALMKMRNHSAFADAWVLDLD